MSVSSSSSGSNPLRRNDDLINQTDYLKHFVDEDPQLEEDKKQEDWIPATNIRWLTVAIFEIRPKSSPVVDFFTKMTQTTLPLFQSSGARKGSIQAELEALKTLTKTTSKVVEIWLVDKPLREAVRNHLSDVETQYKKIIFCRNSFLRVQQELIVQIENDALETFSEASADVIERMGIVTRPILFAAQKYLHETTKRAKEDLAELHKLWDERNAAHEAFSLGYNWCEYPLHHRRTVPTSQPTKAYLQHKTWVNLSENGDNRATKAPVFSLDCCDTPLDWLAPSGDLLRRFRERKDPRGSQELFTKAEKTLEATDAFVPKLTSHQAEFEQLTDEMGTVYDGLSSADAGWLGNIRDITLPNFQKRNTRLHAQTASLVIQYQESVETLETFKLTTHQQKLDKKTVESALVVLGMVQPGAFVDDFDQLLDIHHQVERRLALLRHNLDELQKIKSECRAALKRLAYACESNGRQPFRLEYAVYDLFWGTEHYLESTDKEKADDAT